MRAATDTPQDLLTEARNRLAALELVFFDRSNLTLGAKELDGIVSMFWGVRDLLDEIRPKIALQPAAADASSDAEMRREMDLAAARSRAALAEYAAFYPDCEVKCRVEKDIALIKHLSHAADKLLLDGTTDKGASSETTEAVWAFIEQINDAARRVEDAIEVKGDSNWGLPDEGETAPEPRHRRPAARPPSGGVDLTEDVPPEQWRVPDADDAAGRARA